MSAAHTLSLSNTSAPVLGHDSNNGDRPKRPGGWIRKLQRAERINADLRALADAQKEKEISMLALIAKQQTLLARLQNKIKAMEATENGK